MKTAPTTRPQCGTYAGALRHRRARENYCDACLDARRQYEAERTRRNGPPKRDGSVGVPERYRHGWLSLMEKIAEGNTLLLGDRLEGANCNPRNAHLFDTPDIGGDKDAKKAAKLKRQAAEQLCATCPARDACAAWAATQPRSKHIPIGAFLPTPRQRPGAAA